jgi:hypothetical protein
MQKLEKTIVEFLEAEFDAKARLSETNIKINTPVLNGGSLFRLSRLVTNAKVALEIKRSGTGLVIIINI